MTKAAPNTHSHSCFGVVNSQGNDTRSPGLDAEDQADAPLSKKDSQLLAHVGHTGHTCAHAEQLAYSPFALPPFPCATFNLLALVYIACVAVRVLLAAIMKAIVSVCCFASLLLLQATGGKAMVSVLSFFVIFYSVFYFVGCC